MTQEQSEVVHEVMKRGASCGLPNDSPVSAARCSFATRDDHIAADTGLSLGGIFVIPDGKHSGEVVR